MSNQLLYQIALTLIPGVGDIVGKKLLAYCGGPEAVFQEKRKSLEKIPGIGTQTIQNIIGHHSFVRAEEEITFINRHNIKPIFYKDKDYPRRLQHCADSPLMLYYKGNTDLNAQRVIAVVGTRNASDYGRHLCEQLIEGLVKSNVLIVSGLAYGIDSCAHRASLKEGLPTVGVLAHSLDRIYPYMNKGLAEKMLLQGGLLTEFLSGTIPDRENFPRRNRIVAGMCDAVVVVESAKKGGALITADIANSYNRDVFAFPGRVGDVYSEGCNYFIRTNRAALLESADNIRYLMGWDDPKNKPSAQTKLFRDFSEDEEKIMSVLKLTQDIGIDDIMLNSELTASKVAAILLSFEFEGLVSALPGKRYRLL
ncbi:MAG: DNA-processing protein DprA [Bacteroidales bacterium]|nr:DNA-processing protein DprA [Bacteroidales bacterium]